MATGGRGAGRRGGRRAARRPASRLARRGPLLAVALVGVALLPGFHRHLTSDGVSYLSIAEHYAAGRLPEAVNGYWSPLLAWLLAPLRLVGVPGTVAFKLCNLAVAVAVLWALGRLARRLGADERAVAVVSWALVLPLVAAAYAVLTPDLLVVLPVLGYLEALVRAGGDESAPAARLGAVAGLLGGVAYLAKLFALPFVVVHLPVALGLLAWRRGGRRALQVGVAAVLAGGLVVGAWTAALSAKYDTVTVGSAAEVNLAFLDEGSAGAPPLWVGLLPPPHDDAVSAWEDLPRSAARAGIDPGTGRELDGDGDDAGSSGGLPGPGGLLARAVGQIGDLAGALVGWAPVVLGALAVPALAAAERRAPRRRRRARADDDGLGALIVGAGVLVWVGGVALTYAETRYLWGGLVPAAALAALALTRLPETRAGRRLWRPAAALLLVGMLPWAGNELAREWRASDNVVRQARQAAAELDLEDARVASLGQWVRSVGFCYEAGCRYHGVPRSPAPRDEIVRELDAHAIDYVVAYDPPPPELGLEEPVLVVDDLRIHAW